MVKEIENMDLEENQGNINLKEILKQKNQNKNLMLWKYQ